MPIVYSSLNHPLRVPLAAEVHSRPPLPLSACESLTHFAIYEQGMADSIADRDHSQHQLLRNLCRHFGVTGPAQEARYFYHDFGWFRLKWECHTEFATYTFAQAHSGALSITQALEQVPLCHLPQSWLQELLGKVMVAAHLVLDQHAPSLDVPSVELMSIFDDHALACGKTLQGGQIWTDFLIHADGFNRFVVCDGGPHQQQAARLVQRVLEITSVRLNSLNFL